MISSGGYLTSTTNIDGLIKKLKENEVKISKAVRDKELLGEIGDLVTKNIKGSVRLGKNPTTGNPFRSIKSSTVEDKKEWAKSNTKGKLFSPSKSNLTRSGQLIDSVKSKIVKDKINISATGDRKSYKGKGGKPVSPPTNSELADHLKKKGFDLIGISEKVKKSASKLLTRKILDIIRRSNKK